MTKTLNVLVLATGNSARFDPRRSPVRLTPALAASAPSLPASALGKVNLVALETLEKHGIPLPAGATRSWMNCRARPPQLDFIFTVCASAAGRSVPDLARPSGHPPHWGIPDPAHVEPMDARREAFEFAHGNWSGASKPFSPCRCETMSADDIKAAAR